MIILDARRQHGARPHDCAVCGTTATRVTAPEVISIEHRATDGRCGFRMPKVHEICARRADHPGAHASRRALDRDQARKRTGGDKDTMPNDRAECGAYMPLSRTRCARIPGHRFDHRSRSLLRRTALRRNPRLSAERALQSFDAGDELAS